MKRLPSELFDWYFPFNWDVEDIWELDGTIETIAVELLKWHLEKPLWSSERGKGLLFDLEPMTVLCDPVHFSYHTDRILKADLGYPICLTQFRGREIIIDGIHRLAKAVSSKSDTIDVKIIDEKEIMRVAKYDE